MSDVIVTKDERKYKTLVTDIGKEKMAAAVLNGDKVNITEAAVGDGAGEYYSPTADMTSLKNEVWRGEIANAQINAESANMIDTRIVLDGTVGGFTVREIGLFDSEGDMIVICNVPDTEKALITTGAAATLTLVMHVVFTDTDAVTFSIDPAIDAVTLADLMEEVERHNEDPTAHGGKAYISGQEITIPTDGWEADDASGGLYVDVTVDSAAETLYPLVSILPEYLDAAAACGLSPAAMTLAGAVRFYAEEAPSEEIGATLLLISESGGSASGSSGSDYVLPTATATRLGGVKIGDNVSVSADGTISVDGTDVVDDVSVTDSDTAEMLDEVFGDSGSQS